MHFDYELKHGAIKIPVDLLIAVKSLISFSIAYDILFDLSFIFFHLYHMISLLPEG
jgi:hypothetical protein